MTTNPGLKLPDDPSATDFLRLAQHYVGVEREPQHGAKLQNHRNIATLWSAYLFLLEKNRKEGTALLPQDVSSMMVLLKIARTLTGIANPDDFVDMAGYASISGELSLRTKETKQ